MAAKENVRQLPQSDNHSVELIVPRHGVVTLFGFGIRVSVDRGHLLLEDGIGPDRRYARLPRVGHRLRRLVAVGSDGMVSLAALRWLADQDASFAMLERNGKVLAVTGPVHPSDAKLRRAQALALRNGVGLEISRKLIDAKLAGQERLVRERLNDPARGAAIAEFRNNLQTADSVDSVRLIEAHAALAYFGAFRNVAILWPRADLARIPEHWRMVGSRHSPLSGGPRLAVTPFHAILNYCFALLESESRLAVSALGLDAGLGVGLHTDTANRDSLGLDVLEPVRPRIEDWLIAWIMREPLRRADFFETSTGNCRLMSHLCAKLGETAPTWGKLVAPWAEYVARTLWASTSPSKSARRLSTPLTQQHRREAKGRPSFPIAEAPKPDRLCRVCEETSAQKQALLRGLRSDGDSRELRRRSQSSATPGVPCEALGHPADAQASHPELETSGLARLVNSRGLRQAGAALSRIRCEIPSAFSTRGQRAVFFGYPIGQTHTTSTALGGAGETGGSSVEREESRKLKFKDTQTGHGMKVWGMQG
jgi:CRISPR-associated protein Cas1